MTVTPTPLHSRGGLHPYQLALVAAVVLIAITTILLVRHDVFQSSSTSNHIEGSGIAATQTRDVAPFSGVELAGSNTITIHVGATQSVVVHADHNLLSRVTTQVRGGNLVIGNTPGSFTSRSPMSVDVSVPSLTALNLSGSGVVIATDIKTPSLTVTLSGSGVVQASGSATQLAVTLQGSGDAQLAQLIARDAHAIVSGSGRILVTATWSLNASVPGTGAVIYSGRPAHLTTSITGSGAVTPG